VVRGTAYALAAFRIESLDVVWFEPGVGIGIGESIDGKLNTLFLW
jgi:hypothetical protein